MSNLKQLFESAVLNDETKALIQEAFDKAVQEKATELAIAEKVALQEQFEERMKELPAIVEEATAEVLASITEELVHARTLEAQYAEKLNMFKEEFAEVQEELLRVKVAEIAAAEFEELKEDIEAAKKNVVMNRLFEQFAQHYETMFAGKDSGSDLQARLEESEKALDSYRRKEVMETILSPLTEEARKIAETMLEGWSTDQLESRFEKIRPVLIREMDSQINGKNSVIVESTAGDTPVVGTIVVEGVEEQAQAQLNESIARSLRVAGVK